MMFISIGNRKGGVGKSTTSYNLGYALSKTGKRVLLVDTDTQGHTTKCLGKIGKYKSSYDLIVNKTSLEDVKIQINDKLDLIPANNNLKILENYLNGKLMEFKKFFSKLDYDIIISDCSPSDNNTNDNNLIASDKIIIPLDPQYLSKDGLTTMIEKVNSIREDYNPSLEIMGFLITKFNNSFNHHKQTIEDIEKFLGKDIFRTKIRQDTKLIEACEYGKTIFEYEQNSKGSHDYVNLAKEILEKI